MSDEEKRDAARIPIALRIRLRYADRDTFISKFSANISRGGMFINTRSPKAAGTELRFEMRLRDDSPIIAGEGVVRWIRPYDPKHPRRPHGMGIQFIQLSPDSHELIDEIVARKSTEGGADTADTADIPLSRRAPTATPEITSEQAEAPRGTPEIASEQAPSPRATSEITAEQARAPAGAGGAARSALLSTPLDRFDAELQLALDRDVPSLEPALARARRLAATAEGDDRLADLLRDSRAATVPDQPAGGGDRAATVADDPADAPRAEPPPVDSIDDDTVDSTAEMEPKTADRPTERTLDEQYNVDHSVGDTTDVVSMDPIVGGGDFEE